MEGRSGRPSKHITHIGLGDFYDFFAHTFFAKLKNGRNKINKEHPYYTDKKTYNKIISDFNQDIMDIALNTSTDIKLPVKMGTIAIRKRKVKPYIDKDGKFRNTLPPDWGETLKLWARDPKAKENKSLIRHKNEHTNGFVVTWKYYKNTANFKWKTAYELVFCRTARLNLTKVLKDKDSKLDYYEQ